MDTSHESKTFVIHLSSVFSFYTFVSLSRAWLCKVEWNTFFKNTF